MFQRRPGAPWTLVWFDHTGRRRKRSSRTTDKKTAERILAKKIADAALRREGVIDASQDSFRDSATRPVELHLHDFAAKLRVADRGEQHITTTIKYIESFGWSTLADITADSANRRTNELRKDGCGSRTIQAYLTAAKSFTRWLSKNGKLAFDPLMIVDKPNPNAKRKHRRRALLREEFPWLLDAARAGPVRLGMSGSERALLYSVAVQTGLRSGELRSLTRGNLFLSATPPYITCEAGSAKNRKACRQFITTDLANELIAHVARLPMSRRHVFAMPPKEDVVEMFRADMAEARKKWLGSNPPQERTESLFLTLSDADGKTLDFHSLRHSCGAWLALAGVYPKLIQSIMRHSTMELTMMTYGHLFPGQEYDAIDKTFGK